MSSSFLDSLISALLKVAFLIVWAVQGSVLTVCAAFWTEHTHAQTHTHISTRAPGSQHTSSAKLLWPNPSDACVLVHWFFI